MSEAGVLARATTPDGKDVLLSHRAGTYSLRVDGLELMSSRAHGSEEALARLACEHLADRERARVLIGGLGFGYTLRSALDHLPGEATVVVAEVLGPLLDWHRSPGIGLADLAGRPLEDSRVELVRSDVWDLLGGAELFDAILLDVDNGPRAFTVETNDRLYRRRGLDRLEQTLEPGGQLAIWSADQEPEFERRLGSAGFEVEKHSVPARGGSGLRHTIFLARCAVPRK